jgi:uncharacterized protein
MLIVADTSALLALATWDGLLWLDELFERVWVPPAVLQECQVPGKPGAERLTVYLEGKVESVDLSDFVIAVSGMGRGELEAMALYRRAKADWLLVDDARARKVARLNGIHVVGSLGILLLAKERGLVSEVRPLLDQLRHSEIRVSEALLHKVLVRAGEQQ